MSLNLQQHGKAESRVVEGAPEPDSVMSPEMRYDETGLVLRFAAAEGGMIQARFPGPLAVSIGWPNDEVLHAHPLWGHGLKHYAVQEVIDSDWIEELERRNSQHPRHTPGSYRNRRHFIITFKDETFECIARGMDLTHDRAQPST